MCSIMGYLGSKLSKEQFKKHLEKSISRGPDDTRVLSHNNCLIGFNRLAIMGLNESGMQPFEMNGSLVACNGELYGFRKIKTELESKGYEFKSQSDCEILLPLYREYGVKMFEMLDAEFALVMLDAETGDFLAGRDPIGIRPLYYGYDSDGAIAFASEPKSLVDFCKEVLPFPIGSYYKEGKFIPYTKIYEVEKVITDDIDTATKNIREKLVSGIEKRLDADAPLGFLLSGGLDSSLVCAVSAKILKKPIRTFAVGMTSDAIDLKYAKQVADYIGAEHTEVYIDDKMVLECIEELIYLLGTYDITTIRASIGMYLLCKYIGEKTDIRVLLTGEISDELFGYKYTDFAPNAEEFQKESEKRIRELHMYDVLRADRCVSSNSIEARVPFGDLDFVRYVLALDPKMKMNTYNKGKYLLRKAFEGDYLPESILQREKAAFSDAVGHSMVDCIKEYAENKYSQEEFEKLIKKYDFATPFTKESLYYREIFDKYYGENAKMVADFWMPNKSWEGCNVNDPSARVLSNYGASGI